MATLQETKLQDQRIVLGVEATGEKVIILNASTATAEGLIGRYLTLRVRYQDLTPAQKGIVNQMLGYLEQRLKQEAEIA